MNCVWWCLVASLNPSPKRKIIGMIIIPILGMDNKRDLKPEVVRSLPKTIPRHQPPNIHQYPERFKISSVKTSGSVCPQECPKSTCSLVKPTFRLHCPQKDLMDTLNVFLWKPHSCFRSKSDFCWYIFRKKNKQLSQISSFFWCETQHLSWLDPQLVWSFLGDIQLFFSCS